MNQALKGELMATSGHYNRAMRYALFAAGLVFLCSLFFSKAQAQASSYRWFEVEVLVFRHLDTLSDDPEHFSPRIEPISIHGAQDLITPLLAPQQTQGLIAALPLCPWVSDLPAGVGQFELAPPAPDAAFTTTPEDVFCRYQAHRIVTDHLYAPTPADPGMEVWEQTPVVYAGEGGDMEQAHGPFLMQRSALTFNQVKHQLQRRGIGKPILHTSWRQPVFTRNRSQYLRLFGGQNFTDAFDYFGRAKPEYPAALYAKQDQNMPNNVLLNPAEQQFARIQNLLEGVESGVFYFEPPTPTQQVLPEAPERPVHGLPENVWELDGLMRIYLVGNYLHIETNLNLRDPDYFLEQQSSTKDQAEAWLSGAKEEVSFLRAYNLKQLRRVISHEKHYFDHPKFGVLVEIRRTELSRRR
ncbi:hypothetical protein CWE15_04285 [Aliidiomarina taiwanensis]|uniref:Uncharacterized protein n=1 Tax=Aliidiomarina taiwanensis TaxID=946228 RepID=A0A432XAL3_9GAMM|nr:CsiV family protein [Aliidiomarina taiwanensis]RUO44399.1 hypothetical protein CWE15_04285 [Aliidiomarina taiwanensis]